jgi:hypothetical protein
MQINTNNYQTLLINSSQVTQERDALQEKLNRKNNAVQNVKRFDTGLTNIVASMDKTNELKARVETINTERQEFIRKYVDNRYYQVAVVVLGLAIMALGITAVYQAYTLSEAWITAPKEPGAFGYSNLETLIFYGMMSFGIGFLVAAAIPGIPMILGSLAAGRGLRIAIYPKEFIRNFAPNASGKQASLDQFYSTLQTSLNMDKEKVEELLEQVKTIKNVEEKKQFLIDNVTHLNTSLEHLNLELQQLDQ